MRKTSRRRYFSIDLLESRTLLSTSIPLSTTTWTAMGPAPLASNYGGRVTSIVANPTDANTIYIAVCGGGVWKTTNGGTNWSPLTDNQPSMFMGELGLSVSNPNIIYAGTGEANNSRISYCGHGVLKSTDAGATWTVVGQSIFDRHVISSVQVDPTNPNIVYVASAGPGINGVTSNTGIWKTTDSGLSWTNTTSPISTTELWTDVQVDPTNSQNLYAALGTLTGVALDGVYHSTNGGANWTPAGNFPMGVAIGNTKIAISRSSPNTVYASVIGTGQAGTTYGAGYRVFKTIDGGATWASTTAIPPNWTGTQGWYDTKIIVSPTDPNVVFITGSAGTNSMLRSTNGGGSWADFHTGGNSPHVDHHALAFDVSGRLLDGNDGGVWRLATPATSTTWVNLNGNINTIQFIGIATDPINANIAYGGSQDNGTEKFNDNLNWSQVEGGDGGEVNVSPNNSNRVYHEAPVASFGPSSWFRRSDNQGSSWADKVTGITSSASAAFYAPFSIDPNSFGGSDRLVLGTNQVYESVNNADNWTAISTPGVGGWTSSAAMSALGLARTDVNTVYAAAGSSLFVTTNRGTSWVNRSIAGSGNIYDLTVDWFDANRAYATHDGFTGSSAGHVWRTTNAGATWTDISGNLPDLAAFSLEINRGNLFSTSDDILYLGTDNGVFFTNNGGTTWAKLATGLPNAQARDVEYNWKLGILAAGLNSRGLWELSVPEPVGFWTGLGDNANWFDTNNWSQHILPGTNDNVLIALPGSPLITANSAVGVKGVYSEEPLTINANFTTSAASTFANVSVGGSGTLFTLGGSTTVNGTLTLATSTGLKLLGGGDKILVAKAISLVGTATLDLVDNDMIVDYTGGTVLPQVVSLIASARNGGAWNGPGITSGSAAANHNTTLGAIEGTQYPGGPTFDGITLDGTMVLIKYTYYGDTDFNGTVDGADYARVDSTFNQEVSTQTDIGGWFNGDFDNNGKVDGADYALIDAAFNSQGAALRPADQWLNPGPRRNRAHR